MIHVEDSEVGGEAVLRCGRAVGGTAKGARGGSRGPLTLSCAANYTAAFCGQSGRAPVINREILYPQFPARGEKLGVTPGG